MISKCAVTYNPESCTYTTFQKLNKDYSKKENVTSTKLFGTSTRFKNIKDVKSKAFIITPGANQYDLIYYWKGKPTNKDKSFKRLEEYFKRDLKKFLFNCNNIFQGIYYE